MWLQPTVCWRGAAPWRGWDLTLCSRTPALAGQCPSHQNHQQSLQGMNDPTNYREGQKRDFALTWEHFFKIFFFLWTYETGKVFQVCCTTQQEPLPVLVHPSPPGCLQRGREERAGAGDVSPAGISRIPLRRAAAAAGASLSGGTGRGLAW